jgi:hypothetical protein
MEGNSTNDNSVILSEVEENTTFYYSNFKLFNESSEMLFTKYQAFKRNLQNFLGDDWNGYAKSAIFSKVEDQKMFESSPVIFNNALEIWLELRIEINLSIEPGTPPPTDPSKEIPTKPNSESESISTTVKFEENKVFEAFDAKIKEKFKNHEFDEGSYHAVIQAFYISAIKVWKETVNSSVFNPLLPQGPTNEGFVTESKKFILNKLQNLYKSKSRMLKPILVATERIRDYIYRDTNKKLHTEYDSNPNMMQDEREIKNMKNFGQNLQQETPQLGSPTTGLNTDELKNRINNLSLGDSGSESSYPTSNLVKRKSQSKVGSYIEIKKVNKKTEKLLNQNLIEFASHYVNTFVKTTNKDWQITRTFVTNMVEINYNKLIHLENKISSKANELKNEIKIRFIQPAQEFYNHLMEIWIIFKTNSLNKEILFTEYLEKVKCKLGGLWNEKLVTPTQNFFMTLYFEWNHIKQSELDSEEKILLFIKKVKENMLKVWEENIVKKAEELTNKTINCSN